MTDMIFEKVSQYRASVYISQAAKRAHLFLVTTNSNIYITFYTEGTSLQDNQSPIVSDRQHVYLHVYYSDYPNMIDLLRNEKPVYFFYRVATKSGYLTTSKEPVGESE